MLVSHTHKFVFIHIYKTAGTSIAKALAPYNVSRHKQRTARLLKRFDAPFPMAWDAGLSVEHKTARAAREQLGPEIYDDFFSFSFVRNPWDWQVSIYHHVLRNKNHRQHKLFVRLGSFDRYIQWLCERRVKGRDDRCQAAFLCDDRGRQLVDYVGKFESLAEDFAKVCRQIGVSPKLPKLNSSRIKQDYRRFYSGRTMDLIACKYAEDIHRFDYRFEVGERPRAAA